MEEELLPSPYFAINITFICSESIQVKLLASCLYCYQVVLRWSGWADDTWNKWQQKYDYFWKQTDEQPKEVQKKNVRDYKNTPQSSIQLKGCNINIKLQINLWIPINEERMHFITMLVKIRSVLDQFLCEIN